MKLDETQQLAIARCIDMSVTNRIVPISGAAGTGKTTIIQNVYELLKEAKYDVVLCAPTGKAAKRIFEATGIEAMTIHRLLEYPHPGERDEKTGNALISTIPKRKQKNPLDQKIIIADEYAMVGLELHSNLIAALPSGGRVLMFGDVNQLKPIERHKLHRKESPFEQAIRRFNGVILTTIHRHTEGSGIVANGNLILAGRIPKRERDFALIITNSPIRALREYVMTVMMDEDVNYGDINHQIISPTKKSWVGTYKLNLTLQTIFNPADAKTKKLVLPRHDWEKRLPISISVGDKVLWTENQYDLRNEWDCYEDGIKDLLHYIETPRNKRIMNGETGIVTQIDDEGCVSIDVGDRTVDVPVSITRENKKGMFQYDPRKAIDLAYCITTHKAQGSEYKSVIYILNRSTMFIQCRPNFYTAITRARSHVTVISDQGSLSNTVSRVISRVEEREKNK